MKAFNKTSEIQPLLNNLDTLFKELQIPLLYGELIEDVELSTVAVEISHGLDRRPNGYIVVRKSAVADIIDSATQRENLFLKLTATAPTTVSIWVF